METQAKVVPRSTPEERRKFLNEWADQFPDGTIAAAQQALREAFEVTLKTSAISDIMKAARQRMKEHHRLLRRPPSFVSLPPVTENLTPTDQLVIATLSDLSPQAPGFVQALARLLQLAGIRKVEIRPDGTINVEATL